MYRDVDIKEQIDDENSQIKSAVNKLDGVKTNKLHHTVMTITLY
jgi:hypothetical protein